MLSDHDALFAAVLARPDDDLARLVFADFLEESGHPAQVARAAAESRAHFRDEADPLLDAAPDLMAFRRWGFVDELRAPLSVLRAHAVGVFAVAPVSGLHFEDLSGDIEWLHSALYLRGVRRVKVGPRAWDPARPNSRRRGLQVETLLQCRHLRHVETLDMARNDIDDDWLLWFASRLPATRMGHSLRRLDLTGNALGDAAASLLTAARGLDGLEVLDVSGNRFGVGARAALRERFGGRVRV